MSFLDEIEAAVEGAPMLSHYVPEWRKTVYWHPPSMAERERIEKRAGKSETRATALILILLARDQAGELIFEDNMETLARLEKMKQGHVAAQLARRMVGATAAPVAEGEPEEAPEGNS